MLSTNNQEKLMPMNTPLKSVRIVLCHPSHPGNIGATARAMKNMSLTELYLVQPETFPSDHAIARAAGADELLSNAKVVNTLTEAIHDCKLVVGTSARRRNLPQRLTTPRDIAKNIISANQQNQPSAIVFGHERNGLSNDELNQCHYHVAIPCNPNYSSLNLAAAVQIMAYECFLANQQTTPAPDNQYDQLANTNDMEGFYQHLNQTLTQIDFLDPKFPKRIMPKIRRLLNRANVESTELNILRGILTAINRKFKEPSA